MIEASAFPAIRPPDPAAMFQGRARRLTELSEGHTLAPFLIVLSRLVEAQDAARPSDVSVMPFPLTVSCLQSGVFMGVFQRLLEAAGNLGLVEGPERTRRELLEATEVDRLALTEAVFRGEFSKVDAGTCLLVALAVQAYLAPIAAKQILKRDHSALTAACPCCGNRPVASLISTSDDHGTRYCCCVLCGTLWPYLRAACTSCGDSTSVSYCYIEGKGEDISAECCDSCGTYIKHFRQDRQRRLEPISDDIASLNLDLKMQETRYVRAMPNPLLLLEAPLRVVTHAAR